jgi:hypothetical protein
MMGFVSGRPWWVRSVQGPPETTPGDCIIRQPRQNPDDRGFVRRGRTGFVSERPWWVRSALLIGFVRGDGHAPNSSEFPSLAAPMTDGFVSRGGYFPPDTLIENARAPGIGRAPRPGIKPMVPGCLTGSRSGARGGASSGAGLCTTVLSMSEGEASLPPYYRRGAEFRSLHHPGNSAGQEPTAILVATCNWQLATRNSQLPRFGGSGTNGDSCCRRNATHFAGRLGSGDSSIRIPARFPLLAARTVLPGCSIVRLDRTCPAPLLPLTMSEGRTPGPDRATRRNQKYNRRTS